MIKKSDKLFILVYNNLKFKTNLNMIKVIDPVVNDPMNVDFLKQSNVVLRKEIKRLNQELQLAKNQLHQEYPFTRK